MAGCVFRVCWSSSSGPSKQIVELSGGGEGVVEVLPHAHGLRALPGEDERPVRVNAVGEGEERRFGGCGRCQLSSSGFGMATASRPRYVPQTGQAVWERRGLLQRGQSTIWGILTARWLRRFPWRDLGYFRLGSGGIDGLLHVLSHSRKT